MFIFKRSEIICSVLGIHSKALWIHAEADRVRYPCRRYNNSAAAQQSETAGETHHSGGDRDVCRISAQKHAQLGISLSRLPL